MKPTLLLLAAGMGSRYGGLKQLDGLGPNGETIMDYSIYDAIKAGFTKPELKDENGHTIDPKSLKDEPEPEVVPDDPDSIRFESMKQPGAPKEIGVSQDMSILDDENAAMNRIESGREAEYNPNWETPASELMEIPEMPMIPKEMVSKAVQDYESSDQYPRV